ncbi:DNA-primase RepB domain-containing protein [Sabulicella glaciei]|uniref:RepB family DNA primase n=1 Tax=Sabulicella glaciei TaxID=2984948 RepID=A0ABT3P1G1_9PROT|nr:DNA-primase RepB domain-containing protein [Roseococcus sp. MDT2-1-1]MCW8088255.1 RepB family DNA primase [Roseococcus sp. MDT2-1-1]
MSGRSSYARTRDALADFADAVLSPGFETALVPVWPGDGKVQRRRFTRDELLGSIPWMRWANGPGRCHVFLRPSATRHLLVDDLSAEALAALAARHRLAAVVETSPENFQAWITASDSLVPVALATAAARILAREHGGDPGSADGRHLGRAPGFTNRKPGHEDPPRSGRFPWTSLRHASGGVCPAGAVLLEQAAREMAQVRKLSRPSVPPCTAPALSSDDAARAASAWRLGLADLLPPGQRLDQSRADFSVARHLIRRKAGWVVIEETVLKGERARAMTLGRAADYARRTALAAARGAVPGRRS